MAFSLTDISIKNTHTHKITYKRHRYRALTLIWRVAMKLSGVFASFSSLIVYLPPSVMDCVSLNHLIVGSGLASSWQVITRRFACCLMVGFCRKCGALPEGVLLEAENNNTYHGSWSIWKIWFNEIVVKVHLD